MSWYYVVDGASRGPVSEAEMLDQRQKGTLSPETLVWQEGMAEWVPFRASVLRLGTAAAPVVSAVESQHPCAECGKLFPDGEMIRYENSQVCGACKPLFIQRMMEGVAHKGSFVYASFGQRLVASLLDGVLVFVAVFVIFIPLMFVATIVVGPNHEMLAETPFFKVFNILIVYGVGPAYEIFFIGRFGATLGKMAMKIKVVTPEGGLLPYTRATGRYFGKILSALILYIGYLMVLWDPERRALHDIMCGSRVVEAGR